MIFSWEQWRKVSSSSLQSVELFVTNKDKCFKIHSVSDVAVLVEEIQELKCDHEEADTRIFAHAQHAAEFVNTVVIKSPDTDVFVIAIASQLSINAQLIFDTGTGNNQRRIDISKVAACLGPLWCKGIVGFRIFTGKSACMKKRLKVLSCVGFF